MSAKPSSLLGRASYLVSEWRAGEALPITTPLV